MNFQYNYVFVKLKLILTIEAFKRHGYVLHFFITSPLFKTQKFIFYPCHDSLSDLSRCLSLDLSQHQQHIVKSQIRQQLQSLPTEATFIATQNQQQQLEQRHQQLMQLYLEQSLPIQILHLLLYQTRHTVQLKTLNLSKNQLFLTGYVLSHSALEQWIAKLEPAPY